MGKRIGAFIVGGVIGAGIALLYAPRPGAETRAMVSDKINDTWGQAQEFGVQASENVQQFYESASAKVQEAANNVKPVFTEKNDELREKIEAARARIATQVAKNVEDAQNAVSDQVPMVTNMADDAADLTKDVTASAVENLTEKAEDAQAGAEAAAADATKQ